VSRAAHCLDVQTVQERLDDLHIIDVRTAGEFEAVHIPSSRNRPLDRLDDHLPELRDLVDRGGEVVLMCRTGARAHQAQEQLAAAGLPELPIVEGGVVAWQADGGDVVRDVLRWDIERQVRLVAGGIVATSTAVSVVYPRARFVAGAVGLGLVAAATTNTCAMGSLLAKLPYNRASSDAVA
jgi:rhodanese-related sulfurtransferase